jgi:uncharacterized membrane protein YfcA
MHVSIGTSIALVVPAAIAATRKQIALGNLDLKFYRTWAIGILAGVLVGNVLLPYAPTEALLAIFVAYLLAVAVYEGFLKHRIAFGSALPRGAIRVGVAAVVGCIAALTGTAGGTVTTPILQAFGLAIESAIAIASATGLVTGSVGTLGAIVAGWNTPGLPPFCFGYVDLVIFVAMLPAIVVAAPLGVRAGRALDETWLRRTFAILLVVIAADLILKLVS